MNQDVGGHDPWLSLVPLAPEKQLLFKPSAIQRYCQKFSEKPLCNIWKGQEEPSPLRDCVVIKSGEDNF